MLNKLHVAVALASASIAGASLAADEVHQLENIVVTASRTAQTVDQALAPVTVISRDEIERSQAKNVTELLSKVPGMQMAPSGGAGSKTGVYLRGTRTAHTLVLIDGVMTRSGDFGEAPLQYLDPDQIERIEVVRGPKSSLYGPNAVGGVVHIFTRKGRGDPKLRLKVGGGSHGTGEYGLNYGGEVGDTKFNLGARLYETRGYDRTLASEGVDADDDGYRNKSISGNISKRFANDMEAGFRFSHQKGKSEYDNNDGNKHQKNPYSLFDVTNISGFVKMPVSKLWITKLDLGYGLDKRDDRNGKYPSNATTDRYSLSWQNDISWAENQLLTGGADYSNEKIKGSTEFKQDQRYNAGVFLQNTSTFEKSELQLGVRRDKSEAYGYNNTGNASWGFNLPANMRLIASYGTAFVAPTFYDLYGKFGGNPDLKPEKAESAELELRGKNGGVRWAVNLFQNQMEDMLLYTAGKMQNVDEARIRGLELTASTSKYGWNINSSLSLLDPENRSGTHKGKVLLRRATELFTLDVDRNIGQLAVGGTFRAQGSSYNDHANKEKVAGFGTVDLRFGLALTAELRAELKLVNLMDKKYSTTQGYRDTPRSGFITLIWTPEL